MKPSFPRQKNVLGADTVRSQRVAKSSFDFGGEFVRSFKSRRAQEERGVGK